MTEAKPGFFAQLRSFPATFYVANTMEIFERMAWYGFYAVSSLYITGPVETGALGFTSEQRGQLQAIVPFILYLMPVVTGALADRYGYKRMFIIAYSGMVCFYYLLGQFKTFPTFLLAFLMVAVSAAIFKPVVVGTVGRVTNASNSRLGFGIFYMMVNVGGFFGPLIAGAVRGMSWRYVFIACSLWAFVNLIIVSIFYKEPTTESTSANRRTVKKVLTNAVEVLGNLRFFITVFVVLIALMVANQEPSWFQWWPHCVVFIAVWIVGNFAWDAVLPAHSGNPSHPASVGRGPFNKRMYCSNWRFALYLLILSGFWTSFNQIFLTSPEYIRDFTDTKGMVSAGRWTFEKVGKPEWIDGLAAIEEQNVFTEFDRLVRRGRGAPTAPFATTKPADPHGGEKSGVDLSKERSLTSADVTRITEIASRLNTPDASDPVKPHDLVESARQMLAYKVRITPMRLGELAASAPSGPTQRSKAELDAATRTIENSLKRKGHAGINDERRGQIAAEIATLISRDGARVSKEDLEAASKKLGGEIDAELLLVGVQDAVYRPHLWQDMDSGRQVNPEHIVNFDALAIVLLQVIVSYMMSKFHQFTTMIVGMVIAAIGIGLAAFAGGTMIGPVGGSLLIVAAGIVIFAVGEMMASPTSQEYVSRIAPPDRVAVYMGYYFVSVALGNLFGGILSGQLYGKLARDMQRPDLMWLAFGGIMLGTAILFVLYDRFAIPKAMRDAPTVAAHG